MKTHFILIVILMLVMTASCSSSNQSKSNSDPTVNESTLINKEENNVIRQTSSYDDYPIYEFCFSDEFKYNSGDSTSRIIEDIACIYDESPNTPTNYVLVVDKKKCLIDRNVNRAKIYSVSPDNNSEVDNESDSWGAYQGESPPYYGYNLVNDAIGGPHGCELIDSPTRSVIYSLISDQAESFNCVKMFKHIINSDGSIGSKNYVESFYYPPSMNSVWGVSCVMFDDTNDIYDYLVFISDPGAKLLRIFSHNDNPLDYGTYEGSLDLSPDIPVDVTAICVSQSVIYLYVAVMNQIDRDNDYVKCYSGIKVESNWEWSAGEILTANGNQPVLSYILNIAVHEYNDYPNNQITILLRDTLDFYGIRIFQVSLDLPDDPFNGLDPIIDYCPLESPIFPDGLGIGKVNYNNNWGFFYFVGDKDPWLSFSGNNGDGENIFVYQNTGS